MNVRPGLNIDDAAIAEFCRRWQVRELALFGSVLREDFGPGSDVDILVVFEPDAPWSYWEWTAMSDELGAIFHHPVDLVEKRSIRNPYRRHRILTTREIIYDVAA